MAHLNSRFVIDGRVVASFVVAMYRDHRFSSYLFLYEIVGLDIDMSRKDHAGLLDQQVVFENR